MDVQPSYSSFYISLSIFLRLCCHSLLHSFKYFFVYPSSNPPIPLISSALSFQRTSLTSRCRVIAYLSALFYCCISIGQFFPSRTLIAIFLCIISKLLFP